MDARDLDNRFEYHPPVTDMARHAHESVRAHTRKLAGWFDALLPEGREKSLAITKLEEAMFWANAAVARAAGPEPDGGSEADE